MNSPSQELYDWIYERCQALDVPVFDFLPPQSMEDEVSYPFIHVGNVSMQGYQTKTSVGGTFNISVDIWGKLSDRLQLSSLGEQLYKQAQGHIQIGDYDFIAYLSEQNERITTDTSVPNDFFLRNSLTLVFHLY